MLRKLAKSEGAMIEVHLQIDERGRLVVTVSGEHKTLEPLGIDSNGFSEIGAHIDFICKRVSGCIGY